MLVHKQGITITRVWDRRKSASEQMGVRFEQHNTTFRATRAFVRQTYIFPEQFCQRVTI